MIGVLSPTHNGFAAYHAPETDFAPMRGFMAAPRQDATTQKEDHPMKEMVLKGGRYRTPRRSATTYDYQIPMSPPQHAIAAIPTNNTMNNIHASQSRTQALAAQSSLAAQRCAHVPTQAFSTLVAAAAQCPQPKQQVTVPRRPKMGAPRRSYSVTDYEPVPPTQRPCESFLLEHLPAEIHFAIFDFLDPIDSTCLGLTSSHFYAIHRRMHGKVPLSSRREGPNDMEWAWRGAGPLLHRSSPTTNATGLSGRNENPLATLRVHGQVYCRKCGALRCELHKHIQQWMGPNYEYCEVRQKFGPSAPEGAKSFCYMKMPKNPNKCGRHSAKKAHAAA